MDGGAALMDEAIVIHIGPGSTPTTIYVEKTPAGIGRLTLLEANRVMSATVTRAQAHELRKALELVLGEDE